MDGGIFMMVDDGFVCPECGNTVFKKDYEEGNIVVYCTRCGRIITDSDLLDDGGGSGKSWKDRNFRPNAWPDCYV